VHVLFDETNSLVEIDEQDDDFELGLAKKDLLLTQEEGKNPEEGLGPGDVSVKEGQGLDQTGGSTSSWNKMSSCFHLCSNIPLC